MIHIDEKRSCLHHFDFFSSSFMVKLRTSQCVGLIFQKSASICCLFCCLLLLLLYFFFLVSLFFFSYFVFGSNQSQWDLDNPHFNITSHVFANLPWISRMLTLIVAFMVQKNQLCDFSCQKRKISHLKSINFM